MLSYDFQKQQLVCSDSEMLSFLNGIYKQERYLLKASNEVLFARLDGIIINLTELHFDGLKKLDINNDYLGMTLLDVFHELTLRGFNYMEALRTSLSRFDKHGPHANCLELLQRIKALDGEKCIFKFTKREHMESYRRGELRLKLASSYKEAGFNIAVRDDELNIVHQLLNSKLILKNGTEIPIHDDLIKHSAFDDFYVCCFSSAITPKLFLMFEADRSGPKNLNSPISGYASGKLA